MKVGSAGDLMYVTYFMVRWNEEKESPSDQTCVECGSGLGRLEAQVGEGDARYEGLVCHNCKRLTWVRKD